ncbi:MAG: ApeP family dehydratase [Myxococcales bacterium]
MPLITEVLPHRPPSLLLDELVEAEDERAVARLRVTERSLYFEGEGVPPLVIIEYMAQTIAAYSGVLRRRRGDPVRPGFLLGCRKLELEVDLLRAGDEIRVEARHVWSAPPLGQFECRAFLGERAVASAVLSVYEGSLDEVPGR